MKLLDIQNLYVQFTSSDAATVHNLSFTIKQGETTALVGESGSGKSITALSILGLNPATHCPSGEILFEGEDILRMDDTSRRGLRGNAISFVFQEPMTALNPLHMIGKQLAEIITLHQPDKKAHIGDISRSLLEEVGLEHLVNRLHHYPHQLSGGERQRVMIAMAIANRPALLIADEPTTALDVTTQTKIIELLKRLQKKHNMAILLITHDLHLVKHIAHNIVIMKDGRAVEQGAVANIFKAPEHHYTQSLMQATHTHPPLAGNKNSETILTAEDLSVYYKLSQGFSLRKAKQTIALHPLSLSLRMGETLGVVGESGSGKTSLGLALARLLPSEGTIIFQGNNISKLQHKALRPVRQKLQFVFQDPFSSLNPRMTIGQIIAEGLLIHQPHMSQDEKLKHVHQIIEQVGLTKDMVNRYPHEFSGGQRQRINIARAMILKPACIIFDEPTSALDIALQIQIITLLKEFQQTLNISYVFISHDIASIRSISHQIMVMKEGRVIEVGDSDAVLNKPKQAYTRALINAANYNNE